MQYCLFNLQYIKDRFEVQDNQSEQISNAMKYAKEQGTGFNIQFIK